LTKSNGQPVSDSVYEVKFRLYKTAEGGEHFWEEIQSIIVNDGLISATLGIVNNLNNIPNETYLEVEVEGSVLQPRQEMTAVFYSVISDTAYHAKGYTPTVDMGTLSFQDTNQVNITGGKINGVVIGEDNPLSASFSDVDVSGTITADVFFGSAAGLTGIVAADSIGVIAGENPFTMEGITADDYETSFFIEDPTEDRVITIPNTSGTIITTGNFPN
jgi:hypothetical protein